MYWLRLIAVTLSTLAGTLASQGSVAAEVIDADTALARLGLGVLEDVEVEGAVDLSVLDIPKADLRVRNVRFRGPVLGDGLERSGALYFDETIFEDEVSFENARLGAFSCFRCQILVSARFSDTRFAGDLSWIGVNAGTADIVRFDRARFLSDARFEVSIFPDRVFFQESRFEAPVTFAGSQGGLALFVKTEFAAEAVFRHVTFEEFRFGLPARITGASERIDAVSRFRGPVDFRRSQIDTLIFDAAIFEKDAMLRGMTLGSVSFRNSLASAGTLDLRNSSITGRLFLEGALLSALRIDWQVAEHALAAAASTSETYRSSAESLRQAGQRLDAMRADYTADRLDTYASDISIGERFARQLNWVLWSWPTRNGTGFDRLFALYTGLWCLVWSLAIWARKRIIATPIAPTGKDKPAGRATWYIEAEGTFPAGAYCAIGTGAATRVVSNFTTGLLFSTQPTGARYANYSAVWDVDVFGLAFRGARVLALGLLALAVLVLANRVQAIGALLP